MANRKARRKTKNSKDPLGRSMAKKAAAEGIFMCARAGRAVDYYNKPASYDKRVDTAKGRC